MLVFSSHTLLLLLTAVTSHVLAICQSYGTNFVDKGGPYCINVNSDDAFSFGTSFEGCTPDDVQGAVTPILVDPNNDEYFCSDIPVTPSDTSFTSICDVDAANQVLKSSMISGTWTIIIEGLTFAYARSFYISAEAPVSVTSTPTATFTATTSTTTTITTTNTAVSLTTLPAITITQPSTTVTTTRTVIAPPTITTSTYVITMMRVSRTNSLVVLHPIMTTSCRTDSRRLDRTIQRNLYSPSPTSILARNGTYSDSSRADRLPGTFSWWKGGLRVKGVAAEAHREVQRAVLQPRDGDLCTTTIVATDYLKSVTLTVTGSPATSVVIVSATTTSTITPLPVTMFTGSKVVTITTTAPGWTITARAVSATVITVTKTLVATVVAPTLVPPSGVACIKG